MEQQALAGLNVVEYSHFITGPFCTKLMADLGAEVIKIEEPGSGDDARARGPYPNDTPHPEQSGLFLYLNTNKFGITLNPRTTPGAQIFKDLIREADILVESSHPGVLEELGLGYETLIQLNPRLIMTSITPFGQTGPYRDYKSCDLVNFHMSGIGRGIPMDVEHPEQEPPLKAGGHQSHFLSGMTAAMITVSAVLGRQATGQGQHIDLSEYETMAFGIARDIATYSHETIIPTRSQSRLSGFGTFLACRDGYIQLYCTNERQWRDFIEVMGNPEWADDEMFKDAHSRATNWAMLEPLLLKWTMERTQDDIHHAIQSNHVPCSPVNTMAEVLNSNQLAAREFFIETDHPETGKVTYPGTPCHFSATPAHVPRPAPLLGQHNEQILCQRLGYTKQELVHMRETGVI
ncbi:MAG: CoA transferase [Chloroflexota bacterium]|nr:CoA transferase [Chloroflexota bacterium]